MAFALCSRTLLAQVTLVARVTPYGRNTILDEGAPSGINIDNAMGYNNRSHTRLSEAEHYEIEKWPDIEMV